jgi:hypothetical protein
MPEFYDGHKHDDLAPFNDTPNSFLSGRRNGNGLFYSDQLTNTTRINTLFELSLKQTSVNGHFDALKERAV